MAKTQEELNALKEEVETVRKKLHELTDEELAQVSGGGYKPNGSESNVSEPDDLRTWVNPTWYSDGDPVTQ